MDIISNLSDLLPVLPPFEIETISKDDSKLQVLIQLKVMESTLPLNHIIHSYYEREWEHLKLFQYRTFIKCKIPIDLYSIGFQLVKKWHLIIKELYFTFAASIIPNYELKRKSIKNR
jgi:hypothetical protein